MDILLGLAFWGGLLALVVAGLARMGRAERRPTPSTPPTPHGTPAGPAPPAGPTVATPRQPAAEPQRRTVDEQRLREDQALADGLIIGYALTRDHYRDRIDQLHDHLDEVTDEHDRWAAAARGDDLDSGLDSAEFDAIGGFGVEPWADDLYSFDNDDDED